MTPRALLLEQTLAVARRLLLEQWRQRRGLIFWAAFPAAMMLLFGLVYAHNAGMRAGLDAAAAGILMVPNIRRCQSLRVRCVSAGSPR